MNDALAIYFADVTLASAFVARWCASQKVEIVDGLVRLPSASSQRCKKPGARRG